MYVPNFKNDGVSPENVSTQLFEIYCPQSGATFWSKSADAIGQKPTENSNQKSLSIK